MFDRNLEFIGNESLKQRLKKITLAQSSKNMSYCMTPSDDYLLMKNDIPLDDINDPKKAVNEMLDTVIKNPMDVNDIIITFGIGLGYLLDAVYNKYSAKIIVYEPDIELLHFVLNNIDISEHLASGRVYITNDLDELLKKLSSIYISKDKVEIVYLKNYALVKSQELLTLTQKVYETCKTKMVDVNTITKFSRRWLVNSLINVAKSKKVRVLNLSDLEGKFAGQTALIVAAGPSLNENIEKIKANREKFVVFAVNKVLKTLAENGITPDFLVCLDAYGIENTIAGLEDYCSNINCISDLRSDYVILRKSFKRNFFTFSENDFVVKSLANYNPFIKTYELGGSATTMCFVIAAKLGFSRIVFAGLDLAFKENVLYSNGEEINKVSASQIAIGTVNKNIVKVKSVNGSLVDTREDYATFIKHFEVLIKEYNLPEIYNLTSFGAYIEGMKNVSFDEISLNTISSLSTPIILGEAEAINFETNDWSQNEIFLINNVINQVSKGIFSPALVSLIVKSSLLYEYMQADILNVMQAKFDSELAAEFIDKTKAAIKKVIEYLQKLNLI